MGGGTALARFCCCLLGDGSILRTAMFHDGTTEFYRVLSVLLDTAGSNRLHFQSRKILIASNGSLHVDLYYNATTLCHVGEVACSRGRRFVSVGIAALRQCRFILHKIQQNKGFSELMARDLVATTGMTRRSHA